MTMDNFQNPQVGIYYLSSTYLHKHDLCDQSHGCISHHTSKVPHRPAKYQSFLNINKRPQMENKNKILQNMKYIKPKMTTLRHFLYECPNTKLLWQNVLSWWKD